LIAVKAEEIIDDEDWIEVERVSGSTTALADVTVKITVAAIGRHKRTPKARTYFAFRGKAADWIVANGPRFRVAIAGSKANFVRITPDLHRGKFEFGNSPRKETKRMNLGVVTAWPKEERKVTAADWEISAGSMKLRLPEDFAIAAHGKATTTSQAPALSGAFVTRQLDGMTAPQRSTAVVSIAGEPPPGRSELDRRRQALPS
jgi:hypothetical protein